MSKRAAVDTVSSGAGDDQARPLAGRCPSCDSLLDDLRAEVERLRKLAASMNAEPYWAGKQSPVAEAIDAQANRLQQIIERHQGGEDG